MLKNIKNIIFFLTFIFAILILPVKANALINIPKTLEYNLTNFSFLTSEYNYKNELDRIVEYLDNNYNQYSVVIKSDLYNGNVTRFTNFQIIIGKDINVTDYYVNKDLLIGNFKVFNYSGGISNSPYISNTDNLNWFIDNYVDSNTLMNGFRDLPNGYGAYYTNYTIYHSKNMNWHAQEGYSVTIGDKLYSGNDVIPNYHEYNTPKFIYRNSFSSTSIEDLYSINFGIRSMENNSNNIKFRLQFGANDFDVNNLPTLEMINTTITDINGIPTDKYIFNDYFTLTYDCNQIYEGDSETTCEGTISLKQPLQYSILGFQLNFIFDNLNNYYIHVFDNSDNNYYWNNTQTFLQNYTKYCFGSNHNKAIIRSKTFSDHNTSIFLQKILVSSPEYNLKVLKYDFKNNTTSFDFANYNNYLYNTDYLKYNFSLSETSFVLPVLYNYTGGSNICFYLENNAFVEFYNGNNNSSNIVGIPEDEYNENNQFNPSDDFSNNVDNEVKENEEGVSKFSSFINQLLDPIYKKFPIINQITGILEVFNYNEENDTVPVFSLDVGFLTGTENIVNVIDFTFFLQYRSIVFQWEKLGMAIYTVLKLIKILQNQFGGGE